MCGSGPKWKREVVQDHKFDFVDVKEYHTDGPLTRIRYGLVYVFMIKSILVYCSDLYTMIAMLANNYWSGNILSEDSSSTIKVPFTIGKWIFTGCIIFSILLLAWEGRKARMIIRSRDISYAFTNIMANDYYSLKSYNHFCFFSQINNSKKKKDEFAFFVFFTFKGWKRLLLADGPRQVINGLTLYSFGEAFNWTTDVSKYVDVDGKLSLVRTGVLCTMVFTTVMWAGSAILLTIAALMYIPLLCYIRGNLKEYCCHKIDKRIAELMKRKTKKRLAREADLAKREAAGDYRHLQDKKGRFRDGQAPLPQPTLPTIDLNDEELYGDGKSEFASASAYGAAPHGNNPYAGYPPMPEQGYYGNQGDIGGSQYAGSEVGFPPSNLGSMRKYQYAQRAGPDGFPGHMGYPNDSVQSFSDDKMSIKSHDPLIHLGAGASSASLTRAPSYHTEEGSAGQHGTGFGGAYPGQYGQYYGQDAKQPMSPGQNDSHATSYYEPSPQHPYAEPPYAMDEPQQQMQQHASYEYAQDQHSQHQLHPPANPLARGVSVANRSDVTTFYYLEDRDRASVADSANGQFDLDDYTRASMMNPHLNSQQHQQFPSHQRKGSTLDYLEEGDDYEEDIGQHHGHQRQLHGQQTPTQATFPSNDNDHHAAGYGYHQHAQQDWQR